MYFSTWIIRSVGRSIVSGLCIGVGGEGESVDDSEVGLEVGGLFVSSDRSSGGKYFKGGVNVRIDDSVGQGSKRSVGAKFCRGVDGGLKMSNVESNM